MQADVIVIGAGAAGLVAAAAAAQRGKRTLLLEKNLRPGVKILMSGGTRCNLTHATDARGIISAYGRQGKFLYSALAALSPAALVQLVESEGVATKVEETGKIFPVSDRAVDVLEALVRHLEKSGADLRTGIAVQGIRRAEAGDGWEVQTTAGPLLAANVIVTVGGQSYPRSGTSGDGYAWARSLGHTVTPLHPALTPLTTSAAWVKEMMGVTLPDVRVQVLEPPAGSVLAERRGSLLFTHFGMSGPAALDVSRAVSSHPRPMDLTMRCDFLPDWNPERAEQELQQLLAADGKRHVGTVLATLVPKRWAESLCEQAAVAPTVRAAELSKPARRKLVALLKATDIPLAGYRGYEKAEVTAGGVALDEIDSRTMQSKLHPGLYFAGEVLDLDGPIGGFNFQAAFSTGVLAGQCVARE
jgi:predicted Rossmann fold flavoprotein